MFNIENSPGFLIAKCHQKAFNKFKKKLEVYEITPPQFAALTFLWENDGINQIRLAELMGADRTTISGILDRLEKSGYIKRSLNPEDRRSFILFVTDKSRAVQKELELTANKFNQELTGILTENELKTLIKLLKKLRQDLGNKYNDT